MFFIILMLQTRTDAYNCRHNRFSLFQMNYRGTTDIVKTSARFGDLHCSFLVGLSDTQFLSVVSNLPALLKAARGVMYCGEATGYYMRSVLSPTTSDCTHPHFWSVLTCASQPIMWGRLLTCLTHRRRRTCPSVPSKRTDPQSWAGDSHHEVSSSHSWGRPLCGGPYNIKKKWKKKWKLTFLCYGRHNSCHYANKTADSDRRWGIAILDWMDGVTLSGHTSL